MTVTRRSVLRTLGTLAGIPLFDGRSAPTCAQTVGANINENADRLGIQLVLKLPDGSSLTFDQSAAVDVGDYVGQFVRQRCLLVRNGGWTVFFRPDADGMREEVVVERGQMWLTPGEAAAHILIPYQATIRRGDKVLAQITVPHHWWLARWRWQSAPRPIRRSLADLIAMKAICPLGKQALYGAMPLKRAVEWQAPMGTGGLATAMGEAGERPDLGPITEYQACWLLAGNPEARTTMLTQAEAVGSYPAYARDEKTGSLVDVYQLPNVTFAGEGLQVPTPPLPRTPSGNVDSTFFVLDAAHMPSASYVPWLLTDDPYFYEGMEASATFGVIASNYHRDVQKLPGLTYPGEARAWAWGIRELMRLGAFAPENPPSWLKSRGYWRKLVADNLTFTHQYVESPAKIHNVFHQFPRADFFQPWEGGYIMSSLGWAVWSGLYPEWASFSTWFAGELLGLTDGKSGWDRRWPAPYNVMLLGARGNAHSVPVILAVKDLSWDYSTPDSWAEAWKLFPQVLAEKGSPSYSSAPEDLDPRKWDDIGKIYENGIDSRYGVIKGAPSGPAYHVVMRGALAYATLAGVPGAQAAHDWLHSRMRDTCASYGSGGFFKWAVIAS